MEIFSVVFHLDDDQADKIISALKTSEDTITLIGKTDFADTKVILKRKSNVEIVIK